MASSKSILPQCKHYDLCNGCHFLHTDYQEEINSKLTVLTFLLKKFRLTHPPAITVIPADERFEYRNRIQVHYDKNRNELGQINKIYHKIIPIPDCLLPVKAISTTLHDLYKNENWKKLVMKDPPLGHIEIYTSSNSNHLPTISVNRPYAESGFSQVNQQMNEKLKATLQGVLNRIEKQNKINNILDLFGGNGNLTSELKGKNIYTVDVQINNRNQQFIKINLYDHNAIKEIKNKLNGPIDLIILDPPRSGYKELNSLLSEIKTDYLIYVSCNASTLIRDLNEIIKNSYEILETFLIDLFPGTHHFETMVVIKRKNH